MTSSGRGYLEKLPPDYATNPTKKYPVLFFLHGSGETGNGSPSELQKVKAHGPPLLIENGHNMCFTVNGVEECFIVISPQLANGVGGWWPSILNDFFDYVLNGSQNYRIDKNRVYLTGLSLGGWGTYIGAGDPSVPDIFAAAAPVSAFGNGNGCTISARKIPMWGFHGESDGTISYSNGYGSFQNIINCTTPKPTAEYKWTSYPGLGHDIWENYAYRTDNNLHTPNLYQWLLTKSKNSQPTANAGADITLTLPTNSATIAGSGNDPGGSIASYSWTQVSGGTATITNGSSPSVTVSNLTEGVYIFRLTVTDNDGNPASDDVKVTVTLIPVIVITNPAPICDPATVNITASSITAGSTAGLTYTYWTDAGATTPYTTPTSATSGTYYIKGTTNAGGSNIKPVVVIVNPIPTLLITNPASVCPGNFSSLTASSITTGSSAGLTLSYWTDAAATNTLANPNSVSAGTYYIKGVSATGCNSIKSVVVGANSNPILVITNPVAVCAPATIDLTGSSITAGSSSGLTFTYWTNAPATTSLVTPTTTPAGTFYIKATNASACSSTMPVTVTVDPIPTLVITSPAACAPSTVDLTASSITSGSTSGLAFTYWTDASATTTLSNPSSVSSGTYYIKGTSATTCFIIKPVTVTVNSAPILVITNPTSLCTVTTADLTDASITTGSSPSLTLSYWMNAATTTPLSTPTAVSAGIYYIKVTTISGCSDVKSVTVTSDPIPTLVINNPAGICAPGTIDLTVPTITTGSATGLTFSYWTNSSATSSLTNPATVPSGTYYIKGTNVSGCVNIKPVAVTVNPIPNLVITNPAACAPATVDLTVPSITSGSTSGLSFTYWADAIATTTLPNPSTVTSSTYYIKGTSATTCFNIKPVTVTVNTVPNLVITNPASICDNVTANLTASAITSGSSPGLTFSYWTDNAATNIVLTPGNVIAGTYYIKGTNGSGCSNIKPVIIGLNPTPTLVITNPSAVCSPGTVDLTQPAITAASSTENTYTYWNNPAATNVLVNPTTSSASTYYIKGTNAFGCSGIKPVIVTINPLPNLIINNPPDVCAPSRVDLTSSSITTGSESGLSFTYWMDVGKNVSVPNQTTVTSGTYYIQATNAAICSVIKPVTVTVVEIPSLVITNPASICDSETVDLTAGSITVGSSPSLNFSYWSDASATSTLSNPSIASIGNYYIKGSNATGCSDLKSVIVSANPNPEIVITNPASVCAPTTVDITDLSVTVRSTSGLTYTYWADVSATSSLTNPTTVSAGTFFIKGVNSFGCSTISPVIVTVNALQILKITNPEAVCAPSTVDLTLASITGGSALGLSYTYWTDASATLTLPNSSAVSSGSFYIKGTSELGCSDIKPVLVTINPIPTLIVTNPPAVCSPSMVDLTASSSMVGSSQGLTYSYWSDAGTVSVIPTPTAVSSGDYFIKGTNAFGCSAIKQIIATVNTIPDLTITNPNPICPLSSTDLTSSSITLGSSGGLTYSYWKNISTTIPLLTPSSSVAGTFYIKATDANGCINIKPVVVGTMPTPIAIITPPNNVVCSGTNTNIQLSTASPVNGGVSFSWTASQLSGSVKGHTDGGGNSITQNLTTNNLIGKVRYSIQPTSIISGCAGSTITTDVTVNPAPEVVVNKVASSSVICSGCTTNIVLQNANDMVGASFTWTMSVVIGNVAGQASGTGSIINQVLSKTSTDGIVRYTIVPKVDFCLGKPITFDVKVNLLPTVSTGSDISLHLPANTTVIEGSAKDPDGTIASYLWTKVGGPSTYKLENESTPNLTVKNLIEGTYQFKLTVQDNDGAIGSSVVSLSLKKNNPPFVSAGPDINLKLPTNQISVTGIASDKDGTITSTSWSQIGGAIVSLKVTGAKLELSDLTVGHYSFRFSATDNNDASTSDDVDVIVSSNEVVSTVRKKFFTPNGDRQNDFWELDPDISKIASCKLTILGSDGTKVFETIGYQNNWDGNFNGEPLPKDVYYYILECNGSKESGSITIIR